jgi:hypothetical protein
MDLDSPLTFPSSVPAYLQLDAHLGSCEAGVSYFRRLSFIIDERVWGIPPNGRAERQHYLPEALHVGRVSPDSLKDEM